MDPVAIQRWAVSDLNTAYLGQIDEFVKTLGRTGAATPEAQVGVQVSTSSSSPRWKYGETERSRMNCVLTIDGLGGGLGYSE
jgi:hypothetical protein